MDLFHCQILRIRSYHCNSIYSCTYRRLLQVWFRLTALKLLAPANEALGDECLANTTVGKYPWPEGIALMTIFLLFPLELMIMRYAHFGPAEHDHEEADRKPSVLPLNLETVAKDISEAAPRPSMTHAPGADHLGHAREHVDNDDVSPEWEEHGLLPENYSAQLTAVFILEFGVIFHSIFIGLTLAVAGAEFITLYIVLVFHQTFEGLGLGSRIATIPWPKSKRWTPYILASAYGITTPIAIGIGLGVRTSFAPGSASTLITNGVFDSISAGILIYTGLVELMAHEFLFSTEMRKAPIQTVLSAFGLMVGGAGQYVVLISRDRANKFLGLMALLGYW